MGRLPVVALVFGIWVAITLGVGRILAPETGSLVETVTGGIGWGYVLAAGFLLALVLWQGPGDLGIDRRAAPGTWWLLWFPGLYVAGFLGIAMAVGLPAPAVLVFVLINTFVVGLSEELMFRGFLFSAFRRRWAIWPAILLTSAIFGAVHSLNVFLTGDLTLALMQSSAAFLSGFVFIALRIRTGSLWPPIVLHWLWDFSAFLLVAVGPGTPAKVSGLAVLAPVMLVLPNALYALWLLRRVGVRR